jgi:hypothetical protein
MWFLDFRIKPKFAVALNSEITNQHRGFSNTLKMSQKHENRPSLTPLNGSNLGFSAPLENGFGTMPLF